MNGISGSTTARGRRGEELAAQALQAHNYTIVERNWRDAGGELDLIARDGEYWVFVEVKSRQGDDFGTPEQAVNPEKQRRLLDAARRYLARHDLHDVSWRVDVVAIELAPSGLVQRLTIYRDAVRADG